MKRIALALSTALALAACAPTLTTLPTAPVVLADRTSADEQVAISLELGYKAFRTALEIGVDAGLIKGARAATAAAADQRAYAALLVARAAYRTANAGDYLAAVREANGAITAGVTVVKGSK